MCVCLCVCIFIYTRTHTYMKISGARTTGTGALRGPRRSRSSGFLPVCLPTVCSRCRVETRTAPLSTSYMTKETYYITKETYMTKATYMTKERRTIPLSMAAHTYIYMSVYIHCMSVTCLALLGSCRFS